MDQLHGLFKNPPKGGNGEGIPTGPNPMAVPSTAPQPHIAANFQSGAAMARTGRVRSGDELTGAAPITDLYNRDRGRGPRTVVFDQVGDTAFEAERALARGAQVIDAAQKGDPVRPPMVAPTPTLNPAKPTYRSDGKPLDPNPGLTGDAVESLPRMTAKRLWHARSVSMMGES